MIMRHINTTVVNNKVLKTYATQAISQPDSRQEKTNIALPDDANVIRARNWVDENQK